MPDAIRILPAEFFGMAKIIDGHLDVGGLSIPFTGMHDGNGGRNIGVYVRRSSADLQVMEVVLAKHDGYAQEDLENQNAEAERYPLGPRAYWRSQMADATDEEFAEFWGEDDE